MNGFMTSVVPVIVVLLSFILVVLTQKVKSVSTSVNDDAI